MAAPVADETASCDCSDRRRDRWSGIRPYVVNLTDGQFSDTGRMRTCRHDVDEIFDKHLPAFIEETARLNGDGPVPLVIWAHGGVVSETAGLNIAEQQVPWWIANGAYPLHFVWETGFLATARQILGGRAWRTLRGDSALRTALLERPAAGSVSQPSGTAGSVTGGPRGGSAAASVRGSANGLADPAESGPRTGRLPNGPVLDVPEYGGSYAARPWVALKRSAAAASEPDGGARYVAERLADFCAEHQDRVSLHAVGHSAGAIFHSYFLQAAKQVRVPGFSSLQLLAPAIRVDGFERSILSLVDQDVRRVTVFTMNMAAENADTCFRFYRHSLLYLISRRFEPEKNAPILGLEESIRDNPELVKVFGLTGDKGVADVIFSPTPDGAAADSRSLSTSHGGFDNDPDTMNSVARRVLGRHDIARFPSPGGLFVRDEDLPPDPEVR